ncbi:heme peroxidase, partial [Ostertagia ostertagi]
MRSFENGTFKEGSEKGYPPMNDADVPLSNPPPPQAHRLLSPERLFLLGDSRVNENPGLLSIGIMLFRWHNVIAKRMKEEYPAWNDEELFQAARRWVIATIQIPSAMILRKNTEACKFRKKVGDFPAARLCQNWNIRYGRVHTWNDLSSGAKLRMSSLLKTYELFDSLSNLYGGDIGGLDAFVGGMLEVDGEPGELFKAILKEQFDRLRSSDRFWFENRLNGIFTSEEIERIHNITLKDIIRETIGISDQWLQNNVFVFGGDDPCPQPFQ